MNIAELIQAKYPDAIANGQIELRDDSDGQGPYISKWQMGSIAKPTKAQITAMLSDTDVQAKYQLMQNKQANQAVYKQLQDLDLKTIRPLREGDTAMINTLKTQAIALRAQLLPEA